MPRALTLIALVFAWASATAQTAYEVRQESAPGAGDFDAQPLLGTVTPYDGAALSAKAYYARASGPPYTFQGPRPSYAGMAVSSVNLFFVETADGLTLMTVLGQLSASNSRWQTTTSGPFDALLYADDPNNADDSFTFTAATGTLVADGKIGKNYGDGHVLGLKGNPTGDIFFELDSGTNGLSAANRGPLRVYSPNGATGDTVVEAALVNDRRLRLRPVALPIGASGAPVSAPGWRLLSAPVSGLDVLDLAGINAVLGVEGGVANGPQFLGASYVNARGQTAGNLFHAYEGVESARNAADTADSTAHIYVPVPDTDYTFEPGRGLWWYWYDADLSNSALATFYGTGAGKSYALTDPAFALKAGGSFSRADVSVTFPLASVLPASYDGDGDGDPDASIAQRYFYMGGNPFAEPFNVDGVTAAGGTVQGVVYVWDPTLNGGVGGHVGLAQGTGAHAAVWQGFLIEVTPTGSTGPTVTYSADKTNTAAAPTFYGKTGAPEASGDAAAAPLVAFTLTGETDAGLGVYDQTWLRFAPDAERGFDRNDGSKFASAAARLSFPIRERYGVRHGGGVRRLAMNALPDGSTGALARRVNVRMDFAADAPGTYTLAWDASALPAGWAVGFRDRVTGEVVKTWRQDSYTFRAESAHGWERRFDLVVAPGTAGATAKAGDLFEEAAPVQSAIGEPYPNPASGEARLAVTLGHEQAVRVTVYDALGREVAVAHEGRLGEGVHTLALPTAGLAAGAYVVRVTGADLAEAKRLTVVR